MLADVNGSETCITVGLSHTVAFCRATNSGCKTCVPELGGTHGTLSLDSVLAASAARANHPFRTMCEKGWAWFCIDSSVEEQIPDLPSKWQSALNVTHAVGSGAKELETASFLANCLKTSNDMGAAMEAAKQSQPACSNYLEPIGYLVQYYGGGPPEFPVIAYLNSFAKAFGGSILLGEEYTRAVAYVALGTNLNMHGWLRAGLVVTQLTADSSKVKDGIGRLLLPSDVEKLKHKACCFKKKAYRDPLTKA